MTMAAHDSDAALTGALVEAGWINRSPGGGWEASTSRGLTIGLDLGGTKLHAAIADCLGHIVQERVAATQHDVVVQLIDMVRSLEPNAAAVDHVVVGVPGAVTRDGVVHMSPHVSLPSDRPLSGVLAAALGVPVSVENDVNLAAFGEFTERRRRGGALDALTFVALGTGIGMGIVNGGQVVRGAHGAAGEIAAMPFGADTAAVTMANPGGAFEAAVSTAGILGRYAAAGGRAASVRDVFDRADAGEAEAVAVLETLVKDLALGLAGVVAILDPGLIVIGGGIGSRAGFAASVGAWMSRLGVITCAVEGSAMGERAGVLGALAYGRRQGQIALAARSMPTLQAGAAA